MARFAAATIAILFALLQSGPTWAQDGTAPTALSETYQDWVVACQTVQSDAGPRRNCSMSQELRQAESRQLVFSARIAAPNAEGIANANLIAPFGLLLANGVRFQVDEGEVFKVDFRTCLPAGCLAIAAFGPNAIQAMRGGAKMNVILTNSQTGEDLTVEMSLNGFSTAMNRLVELQNG